MADLIIAGISLMAVWLTLWLMKRSAKRSREAWQQERIRRHYMRRS